MNTLNIKKIRIKREKIFKVALKPIKGNSTMSRVSTGLRL